MSGRTRAALIAGLGGLLAIGILVVGLRSGGRARGGAAGAGAAPEDQAGLAAELADLKSEVRNLRAQVRQTQGVAAGAAASCDPAAAAAAAAVPGQKGAGSELTAVMDRAYERAQTESKRLDDRLLAETRDPAWAADYEQRLRRATEASLTDAAAEKVTRAECRSTMCRLEVKHGDAAQEEAFRTRFRMQMPDAVYRVSQLEAQDGTGSHVTVLHVLRKDHPIPQDQPAL